MKKIAFSLCAAAALLTACNSEEKKAENPAGDVKVASASTEQKEEAWVPVDSAKAMEAWMKDMNPGPQHAMMAKWDGTWNAETTMWMAEGAPAEKSSGTAVNKTVMGGRYQNISFKGNMMGQPYEGQGTLAYDNGRKLFVSNWMDNMSTGMMKLEGPWDEATKSMTLSGTMYCSANGKDCKVKEIYKVIDDNTHEMEMWGPDMKTGKEYKNMVIRYTRK